MNKNEILVDLSESEMTKIGKQDLPNNPCRKRFFRPFGRSNQKSITAAFHSIFPMTARNLRHSLWKPSKKLALLKLRIFAIVR